MTLSIFDLFKVGIGPSSSHTVGPMVAARRFLLAQQERNQLSSIASVTVDLFGSLALTGEGHATPSACILGLCGAEPASIDPDSVAAQLARVRDTEEILLLGQHPISFVEQIHLILNKQAHLSQHPNGMIFTARDADHGELAREIFFSVGGGFVLSSDELEVADDIADTAPLPFASAVELLALGKRDNLRISEIIRTNELSLRSATELDAGIWELWQVMDACIERGCATQGHLPGGLNVKRRAWKMARELQAREAAGTADVLAVMDWVNLFALAVNEENAAGGRVVTAPTNGAAGVIPAVLAYYCRFVYDTGEASLPQAVQEFLLTATAIGTLFKRNASISAAEVGCQGEIGVACSMAAAGLTAVLGGTNSQIENAAEIGMEHNLGLTCDPVGGLVQIPCIERNTMGAVKAINASRLALRGDGKHFVSLDSVIKTMRDTGLDMQSKYKETSAGGLAVNYVEC